MKNYLIILAIAMVFVAGCGHIPENGNSDSLPKRSVLGEKGLVLSFLKNAPPENLFPNTEMKVGLLIENKGAAQVDCSQRNGCGYFFVDGGEHIVIKNNGGGSGILKNMPGFRDALNGDVFRSRQKSIAEFSVHVNDPGHTTTATIFANICYPYKTFMSTTVCVETAGYSVEENERLCNPKTIELISQGAPVAITRVEQSSIFQGNEVKPRFKIFMKNVGGGFVISKEANALKKACASESTNPIEGNIIGDVSIEEATLSGVTLNCQDSSVILRGSNNFVLCTANQGFEANADDNFVSPLRILLSYGYQTAEARKVRIEVVNQGNEDRGLQIEQEHGQHQPSQPAYITNMR